jgi:SpoVK/Ycf46/Vps4 family AAA+-type ATPase
MILVCGPTGSGKTTTLYAILRDIDVAERNVVTIEDPVEIQIDGVTQIPVNEQQGNSFSNLLKSVLRQDPDIMLVGEVRDAETARTAMQAAMTGHWSSRPSTRATPLAPSTAARPGRRAVSRLLRLADGAGPAAGAPALPALQNTLSPTAEQISRLAQFGIITNVTESSTPRVAGAA